MARKIQLLEAGATAGNVDTTFTVPSQKTWKFLYGQAVLTTDVTAANRIGIIQLVDDASAVVMDSHAGAAVTASLTNQHLEFMQGIYRETSITNGALQVPIPAGAILSSGWGLNFTVTDGQAGDSYTIKLVVEVDPE